MLIPLQSLVSLHQQPSLYTKIHLEKIVQVRPGLHPSSKCFWGVQETGFCFYSNCAWSSQEYYRLKTREKRIVKNKFNCLFAINSWWKKNITKKWFMLQHFQLRNLSLLCFVPLFIQLLTQELGVFIWARQTGLARLEIYLVIWSFFSPV